VDAEEGFDRGRFGRPFPSVALLNDIFGFLDRYLVGFELVSGYFGDVGEECGGGVGFGALDGAGEADSVGVGGFLDVDGG